MKKYLLTLSMIWMAWGGFAQTPKGYGVYHNERFDFCVLYPKIFNKTMGPVNGDGRTFIADAKKITMQVYGMWQMPGRALKKDYELAQKDKQVTNKTLGKDYYILSGKDKGHLFYQKAILKGDLLVTIYFDYLPSDKKQVDEIIAKVTKSLPRCNQK